MEIVFLGHIVCFLGHIVSGFCTVWFLGRVLRLGHDVSLLGHENRRFGHIVFVFSTVSGLVMFWSCSPRFETL